MLAIMGRQETVWEKRPFHHRICITNFFIEIARELGILLFPVVSSTKLESVAQLCDGLILPGSGNHIHPAHYGDLPLPGISYDTNEFELDRAALLRFADIGKPILGICGGLQSINVAFGGSLYQDIPGHDLDDETHPIFIEKGSFLERACSRENQVNSFHRQAVREAAPGFEVTARGGDGVIEAIERGNILGVQWHPERAGDLEFFRLFLREFF